MRSFALSGLLLFMITCSSAQSNSVKKSSLLPSQAAIFDKYIQDAMPLWKVPGLSVAVVKDGKVVFKKGYGTYRVGEINCI